MAEFEIPRFDDPLPIDRVIFAIRLVDSFTGGTVRGPVEARIKALGVRARRNLTGLLVFVNLDTRPTYDVQIEARAAGFFDVDISVPRPADDASDAQRLQPVQLQPLPTAPFTHETTLVRGVVVRAGAASGRPDRSRGTGPGRPDSVQEPKRYAWRLCPAAASGAEQCLTRQSAERCLRFHLQS